MNEVERLGAVEAIRNVKAAYFRGVDTANGELVRSILATDCRLDYRGCCTDPVTGVDHMPAMNVVLQGRDSWVSDAFEKAGIVSVHHGHHAEISVFSESEASGVWAMTDRFFTPAGAPFKELRGFGYYHETYVKEPDGWKLSTTRIERLRVETW